MTSYSILVADDEPDLRELVKITLEAAGHRVVTVADGRKASAALQQQKFDLVITDVLMPDRDGIELIREIRAKYSGLRVIVMTAGGQISRGDYLMVARHLGAHLSLPKPFSARQMAEAVTEVMTGVQP
jgi:DNA-binding NtrC family response regulator